MLRKIISIGLVSCGIGIILGFALLTYQRSQRKDAGLKVESNVPSIVYIDNVQIGNTPIDVKMYPEEVSLKIVPTDSSMTPYQTRVVPQRGAYTIIKRNHSFSEESSSGSILTAVPQPGRSAGISVQTINPESAAISINGQPQGFSPVVLASVPIGEHQIQISSPGFDSLYIDLSTYSGYRLNLLAKLAKTSQSNPAIDPQPEKISATSTNSASLKKQVTILNTPTGFLRVRSSPDQNSIEIAKIKPGETYELLDQKQDWILIGLSDSNSTTSGWISSQYTKTKP